MKTVRYLLIGIFFGIVLFKSEAVSWYRIYEMFEFDSFHMYGIIGSALAVGIIVLQLINRTGLKDSDGKAIEIEPKDKGVSRYLIGGIFFGLGWALAGACPGPMYIMVGAGAWTMLIVIFGAVIGTYLYGVLKDKLPH